MLTANCADSLAQWLAKHGIAGPSEEREETDKQEDALFCRFRRYSQICATNWIMAPDTIDAESNCDFGAMLSKIVTDNTDRVAICFKLFGCDEGSWNYMNGLDEFIIKLLQEVDSTVLWDTAYSVTNDTAGFRGVACWIPGTCSRWVHRAAR